MKKKVLFALIALFSFVSAWAAGETVVNKDGAIGYVVLPSNGGIAATALAVQVGDDITPGTAIYEADATTLVETPITTVGNYFLKVDDYGIVRIEEKGNFYLPANSKIQRLQTSSTHQAQQSTKKNLQELQKTNSAERLTRTGLQKNSIQSQHSTKNLMQEHHSLQLQRQQIPEHSQH